MGLLDIPLELVEFTFAHVDWRSLVTLRLVCATFRTIIDDSAGLQYSIALGAAHLENGPSSSIGPALRLKMLRQFQSNWASGSPGVDKRVEMEDGELWELYGNVLAQRQSSNSFKFLRLPAYSRGIDEETWVVQDLDVVPRDFGLDHSQDLFILVERVPPFHRVTEFRIHFRTLSTGQIHPKAAKPGHVVHIQDVPESRVSLTIQSSEEYIAVLFHSLIPDEVNQLLVWNWHTGVRHTYLVADHIRGFSFIEDHHLVIAAVHQDDETSIPALKIWDILSTNGESIGFAEARFVCYLTFPEFQSDVNFIEIIIRSDPSPQWRPSNKLNVPFYHSRGLRLYVVTFWVVIGHVARGINVFIPSATLQQHITPSDEGTAVPWDRWGPHGSRLLKSMHEPSSVWVCYVYGEKYVTALRSGRENILLLYDFNATGSRLELAGAESGEGRKRLRTHPTTYKSDLGVFEEDVTTHLVFSSLTIKLGTERSHVMCAEDTLVLVDTVRGHSEKPLADSEEPPPSSGHNDFILSILRANPSLRDSRSYLASFGPRPQTKLTAASNTLGTRKPALNNIADIVADAKPSLPNPVATPSPIVNSILDPVVRRTALVKVQGPFTDVQLDSIARGLVYLEKLGLVSVIVVENDTLSRGDENDRSEIIEETMRIVTVLEKNGAKARPVLGSIVRLGPKPEDHHETPVSDIRMPEAHTIPSDLVTLRSALRAGEIPVIPPFALDSFCRSVRIHANDVLAALARGMSEIGFKSMPEPSEGSTSSEDIELTPLRLMIINREGGIPSYARSGYPHLLINLASETAHIRDSFRRDWQETHPTALSNLNLARTCLHFMPSTASAIMVSHRSPSSLIGNLITNKPALSSSLPHALLQGNRKLTPHTPTILRRGLDIRVIRNLEEVDWHKLTVLLEQSFQRTLDGAAFYNRLKANMDFIIVAGDYAGAAIVTNEPCSDPSHPISYLDKFAVLPSHQGDGTVDFLWVALHDESYGLGHPSSVNPNGGKEGKGEGRDLVWRSRSNNPVNKWYFERSTGHMRDGSWVLFWCDAEKRLKTEQGRRGSDGLSYIEEWERGRLGSWTEAIMKIPSVWK